ncbi:MAG: radical SAM family heme chaperone HemW [Lachnospiraceae bacterium]|nr:radical SAM family heme chaperone HemW [Lachnospiraceae bacterium]
MEIYVHVPFCVRKCGYCDFVSASAEKEVQNAYMKALRREIGLAAKEQRGEPDVVISIFFGGGTPSIIDAGEIAETLACIRQEFMVAEDAEITLEANPGTLTREKLEVYRKAGVNRLSIGLQSADDGELSLLGRIHTFAKFKESYRLAREACFQNINVDLMAALPGQSVKSFKKSLLAVRGLSPSPEHISVYSLIIEEGTPFYEQYHRQAAAREVGEEDCRPLPTEEEERKMYALTGESLAACGYERYEISNYAKPGFSCRHNMGYWTGVFYLGFGISAASYINGTRFFNTNDLETYLKLLGGEEDSGKAGFSGRKVLRQVRQNEETVTTERAMEEFMFLGLRTTKGVSEGEFVRRFRTGMEELYGTVLKAMEQDGLMERIVSGGQEDIHWRLTARGIDISNYVLAKFLF